MYAQVEKTYPCEDFLALELVQLCRALLQIETRFVTGSSHVGVVVVACSGDRKKVAELKKSKAAEVPPANRDAGLARNSEP